MQQKHFTTGGNAIMMMLILVTSAANVMFFHNVANVKTRLIFNCIEAVN